MNTAALQPGESHVAHLFAFCLGVVAGTNSQVAAQAGQQLDFEDLPQGYSLAGTSLDKEAGDALLQQGSAWYLLEMKRGFAQLRESSAQHDHQRPGGGGGGG